MTKVCLSVFLILGGLLLQLTPVRALEGDMATEFAYLSGQTRQAMELSSEELEVMVVRCDRLLEKTENLQRSEKKIMGKKLARMRGLFLYVMESKQRVIEKEPEK